MFFVSLFYIRSHLERMSAKYELLFWQRLLARKYFFIRTPEVHRVSRDPGDGGDKIESIEFNKACSCTLYEVTFKKETLYDVKLY